MVFVTISIYQQLMITYKASLVQTQISTIFGDVINRNSECFYLLLLHTHYMFRPLWAIFRWNIYTS
jgi:hypothetical protein